VANVEGARPNPDTSVAAATVTARDAVGLLETVADVIADLVVVVTPTGDPLWMSESTRRFYGAPGLDVRETNFDDLIHPDDRDELTGMFTAAAAGEVLIAPQLVRVRRQDATWRTHEVLIERRALAEGRRAVVIVGRDVTEQLAADERLRAERRRFEALVARAADVIVLIDATGTVAYASPGIQDLSGWNSDEVLGGDPGAVLHPDDAESVSDAFTHCLELPGEVVTCTYRLAHRDGGWRWIEARLTNLFADPAIAGVVVNARDVTKIRSFEEKLARHTLYEPVTGLANRTLLLNRIRHALDEPRFLVAVLVVQVDRLHVAVEAGGHESADRLARAVATRLSSAVRPTDTLARLGDDTFALVCEHVPDDRRTAINLAQRIHDVLTPPFPTSLGPITLRPHVGIATGAAPGDPDALLRDADAAAQRARSTDRPLEVFQPAIREALLTWLATESDLTGALDQQQLEVHYQPIVAVNRHATAGYEALLRWQHPERGLLFPDSFLPVAEARPELMEALTHHVLREACTAARTLPAHLTVSVNLSARDFESPSLATTVAAIIDASGLPPQRVGLEITETVLMSDLDVSVRALESLRELGVRLIADDFGTGYSSLSYLKHLPLHTLKIDRSFVAGLPHDLHDTAIVTATINLAHAIGLTTIAEGIETKTQLDCLTELGCDAVQGFLLGRPAPQPEPSRL
jgi:PAS domain S-box-containing protein/diguanylate cyclase (GGDEF)-like protein